MKIAVMTGLCLGLLLLTTGRSSAQNCDPNEECSRCVVPNLFGGCVLYGNDPDCEIRKKICQETDIPVPPPPVPPQPADLNSCIQNPAQCPEVILKDNPFAIGQPIVTAYLNDLRGQANGRWNTLPPEFVAEFEASYPEIDFQRVRYANDIHTGHGQSMTLCYEVFLAESFDPTNRISLALMLHELYHTVQCVNRGGVGPFMDEYIAHSIGTIVNQGSIDIHDDIDLERDAEARSQALIDAFGWPFVIHNDCEERVRLLILAVDDFDEWTTTGWYTFEPGEHSQLDHGDRYLHSTNMIWYLYAEGTETDSKWAGDRDIEFNGEHYLAREKDSSDQDERFAARLTCEAQRGTSSSNERGGGVSQGAPSWR